MEQAPVFARSMASNRRGFSFIKANYLEYNSTFTDLNTPELPLMKACGPGVRSVKPMKTAGAIILCLLLAASCYITGFCTKRSLTTVKAENTPQLDVDQTHQTKGVQQEERAPNSIDSRLKELQMAWPVVWPTFYWTMLLQAPSIIKKLLPCCTAVATIPVYFPFPAEGTALIWVVVTVFHTFGLPIFLPRVHWVAAAATFYVQYWFMVFCCVFCCELCAECINRMHCALADHKKSSRAVHGCQRVSRAL
ncbi:hypothetical protein COO60DRAFT_732775 [Scenedesmus sp. NREL 46B-D3]|nr:hypothetical protein COO60DRAFT_732775 [Scenedesmus sp. NREL 46B-D3]